MKKKMTKKNEILHGDSLTKLKELDSESIDCIITSPPYWALRDYKTEGTIWDGDSGCEHDFNNIIKHHSYKSGKHGPNSTIGAKFAQHAARQYEGSSFCSKCNAWKGELGQEPTIDLYISHLIQIFNECKRVLKKEGTCWVVLGDTYSSQGGLSKPEHLAKANVGATKAGVQRGMRYFSNKNVGITDKSLCMIPERFTIKMIDNGWILRNKIIWWKPNCMPSSAKDRFTVDYENVYFFTKSKKYYFKTQYESLAESTLLRDKYTRISNGKDGQYAIDHKHDSKSNGHSRIKRCVWSIPTKPFPEAHFAVFPEQLVRQCLDAGCPSEGTVLDPFMGSGTVALVVLKTGRNFMGIELNEDYIKIALKRIEPYLYQAKLV